MANDALRKIHSFTGLFPLGAYLLFHAWEHWPARAGRDAELERLSRTAYVPLEIALVVLPLLAHAGLGFVMARRVDETRSYRSRSFRRLQLVTGVAVLVFLLCHLAFVWLPALGDPSRPIVAFDAITQQAGSLLGAALHVLALTAVCAHFGQGVSAVCLRHGHDVSPRVARGLGLCTGLGLWLVLLDELAAYAAGGSLL